MGAATTIQDATARLGAPDRDVLEHAGTAQDADDDHHPQQQEDDVPLDPAVLVEERGLGVGDGSLGGLHAVAQVFRLR